MFKDAATNLNVPYLGNRSKSDPCSYELFCLESHTLSFPKVLQIPPELPCISHVLSSVVKSQFDIISKVLKRNWIKLAYICSKLNEEFQIFGLLGKVSFILIRHSLLNSRNAFIEFSSKYFVSPFSPKHK